MRPARAVQALAAVGVVVAVYALYVEANLSDPFYVPACNVGGYDCGKVLSSSYAHILSHWGLVPRGHFLDLSLATSGIFLYSTFFVYPFFPCIPARHHLLLAASVCSVCFSVYLLYVLKFKLGEMCLVCTCFHLVNFSMFVACVFEWKGVRKRQLKTE